MSFVRYFSLLLLLLSQTTAYAKEQFELVGDYLQIILPTSALVMTYTEDDIDGRWQFIKSFSTTTIATQVLKHTVKKPRPVGDDLSFPSGHTSASFAGASFIQTRYGWKWGLPAYVAATYVGWSRVEADQHYVEDVLAGAALAIGVNHYFVTPKFKKLRISLIPAKEGMALGVSGRF